MYPPIGHTVNYAGEAQDSIRQHVQMRTECHQFKSATSEEFSGSGLPLPLRLCRWFGTGLSFMGLEGSGCLRSNPLLTQPRVRDWVLQERDVVYLCRFFFIHSPVPVYCANFQVMAIVGTAAMQASLMCFSKSDFIHVHSQKLDFQII